MKLTKAQLEEKIDYAEEAVNTYRVMLEVIAETRAFNHNSKMMVQGAHIREFQKTINEALRLSDFKTVEEAKAWLKKLKNK